MHPLALPLELLDHDPALRPEIRRLDAANARLREIPPGSPLRAAAEKSRDMANAAYTRKRDEIAPANWCLPWELDDPILDAMREELMQHEEQKRRLTDQPKARRRA